MTILIVENSLLVSNRIKNLLLETGQASTVYQSIGHKKAPVLFEEIETDILLLDMYLPDNMSFSFLEKAKAEPQTKIVALVNREDFEKQVKCKSIGAHFIIDKYHDFEHIPGLIELIAGKQNRNSLNEQPDYDTKFA